MLCTVWYAPQREPINKAYILYIWITSAPVNSHLYAVDAAVRELIIIAQIIALYLLLTLDFIFSIILVYFVGDLQNFLPGVS